MHSYRVTMLLVLIVFSACGGSKMSYLQPSGVVYSDSGAKNGKWNCETRSNYLPDTNYLDHTPVKYVRVNFHYFKHNKDIHPMSREIAETFSKQILSSANYKLSLNAKMNLPIGNTTPVYPVMYRYKLTADPEIASDNGIYIHETDDEKAAYYVNKGKHNNMFSSAVYNQFGLQKEKVLNVFIFSHHPDSVRSKTYKVKSQGIGYSYFVKIALPPVNFVKENQDGSYKVFAGEQGGLLNHEIGHSLGLIHTWNSEDGCEDTPKHPNCWNKSGNPPCNEAVSNNMMDYNATKDALTPCQQGKILYNMSVEGRSQRKILEPGWCTYNPGATVYVKPYETVHWYGSKDMEGDIVINGELVVHCTVSMPAGSKVIVKPGGKLTLDSGKITNLCGEKWEGVVVYSRKNKSGKVSMTGKSSITEMMKGDDVVYMR